MIRRSFIGLASAVALVGATACTADPNPRTDPGGGDGNQSEEQDVGAGGDSSDEDGADGSEGTDDDSNPGAEDQDGGSAGDAGTDAAPQEPDMDAGGDGGAADGDDDAGREDDAGVDAGVDEGEDAGTDAGTGDELPALAAHYSFDENTGTSVADSAGSFGDAVLENGASFGEGVSGSALALAGGASENYVSLPVDILDTCDDITVALWMKLGSVTFWSRLLDIDGGVDGFLYFTPAQDIGGVPHLLFNIYHPPGEGADDQRVSAAYPAGTTLVDAWHHVAFTLSAGTGRLYFDGVEIGSGPMTTKPSDLTLTGATPHAWIGRSMFPDPYLDASIDDLRVSCTAYDAEQVAALAE